MLQTDRRCLWILFRPLESNWVVLAQVTFLLLTLPRCSSLQPQLLPRVHQWQDCQQATEAHLTSLLATTRRLRLK